MNLKSEDIKMILFSRYLKIKLNLITRRALKTRDRNLIINKDEPEDIDVDEMTRQKWKD